MSAMKKVAVYFTNPDVEGYPFNHPRYKHAYQELDNEIKLQGGALYIVRGKDSYLGKGKFNNSWQFNGDELVNSGTVTVDSVYNKPEYTELKFDDVKVINYHKLDQICSNKWLTYQNFKDITPLTFKVETLEEYQKAVTKIDTERVVIKPIEGFGGDGIIIDYKENIDANKLDYPVLVQKFLDTSGGIPGYVDGVHDFRIVYSNGIAYFGMIRTPREGDLRSNVHLGGQAKLSDIPDFLKDFANKIDSKFREHGDYLISIDCGVEDGVPYLIEINSRPGLKLREDGEGAKRLQEDLAKILLN